MVTVCLEAENQQRNQPRLHTLHVQPKTEQSILVIVVFGGINQQRNQIVDAVVIASILGAALVVPILQVIVIWGDERFVTLGPVCRTICFSGFILVEDS
ncbi:GDP-fucose protein O-fucosyltransferase [Cynara cardunculus var. scolymus]|uniref:O-fucosyltransferase family protein n=1 Tax=Cynara cardunculus var. scolymus TaxID=59895 RepID=A0A103XJW3_CYNCS|nr:GDP-fucose protein O-fucosyltransferase [Cynara cardunculus var. scolymus]